MSQRWISGTISQCHPILLTLHHFFYPFFLLDFLISFNHFNLNILIIVLCNTPPNCISVFFSISFYLIILSLFSILTVPSQQIRRKVLGLWTILSLLMLGRYWRTTKPYQNAKARFATSLGWQQCMLSYVHRLQANSLVIVLPLQGNIASSCHILEYNLYLICW